MADRYCAENIVFQAGGRTIINDISLSLSQGELICVNWPERCREIDVITAVNGLSQASQRALSSGG